MLTRTFNFAVRGFHENPEPSRSLKYMLDRGAKISAALTPSHYLRSPLVQGGMEIPCKVTAEMSPTLKNSQLLDRLMQLVETVYSEPASPIIFDSFLAYEIRIKSLSNETRETKSLKAEKKTNVTELFGIRDEFQKWRAIRASVSGVGVMIVWVAC